YWAWFVDELRHRREATRRQHQCRDGTRAFHRVQDRIASDQPSSSATLISPADQCQFAAVHESPFGTFRTWPDVRLESAFGGRADVICSERVFPVLTPSRHKPG